MYPVNNADSTCVGLKECDIHGPFEFTVCVHLQPDCRGFRPVAYPEIFSGGGVNKFS
jgi:hypothetical protein